MNSKIGILAPFLVAAGLLAFSWHLYQEGQAREKDLVGLREAVAAGEDLKSENRRLEEMRWKHDELARLRQDNEEMLRLRKEIEEMRNRVTAAPAETPRGSGGAAAALPTPPVPEPVEDEKAPAPEPPEVDTAMLQSVAMGFLLFAEENDGSFPRTFSQVRPHVEGQERGVEQMTRGFEITAPATALEMSDPAQTILFRSRQPDGRGMRYNIYADGRVAWEQTLEQ